MQSSLPNASWLGLIYCTFVIWLILLVVPATAKPESWQRNSCKRHRNWNSQIAGRDTGLYAPRLPEDRQGETAQTHCRRARRLPQKRSWELRILASSAM